MTKKEVKVWKNMMEEVFFLQYHLHMSREEAFNLSRNERKRLVDNFLTVQYD